MTPEKISTIAKGGAHEKIHGFLILHQRHFPRRGMTRAGRVLLVDRGSAYPDRYVVAAQYRDGDGVWDEGWDNGAYCATAFEADEAFQERIRQCCT